MNIEQYMYFYKWHDLFFSDCEYLDLTLLLDITDRSDWEDTIRPAALQILADMRDYIRDGNIHVAIVTSRRTEITFRSDETYRYDELVTFINDLRYSRESAIDLYAALQRVTDVYDELDRATHNNLLVVLTNAPRGTQDDSRVENEATALVADGVDIFCLYVDNGADIDLLERVHSVETMLTEDFMSRDDYILSVGERVNCDYGTWNVMLYNNLPCLIITFVSMI